LESHERSGFRILYENIDPHLSLDFDSDEQREMQAKCKEAHHELVSRLASLGLDYQGEHIPLRSTWVSADFMLQDWQCHGLSVFLPTQAMLAGLEQGAKDPEGVIRAMRLHLTNPSHKVNMPHVIWGRRDRFAAKRILQHVKRGNVATFWGAIHILGMTKRLINVGFKVRDIEWIPAVDLNKLKAERG
jgi:hypothetical protein